MSDGRRPEIEAWLDVHGVAWEFDPVMPVESIDFDASLANQARLEALDEEAVERYSADMERGDVFPAVIIRRVGKAGARTEKRILVGGNHRTAAARRAKRETLPAYIVKGDTAAIVRLMYEDNRRHGLPLGEEERVLAALHLIEMGDAPSEAARTLGLTHTKVAQAHGAREADRRAAQLGVDRFDKIPRSLKWRLQAIPHDRVFAYASTLTLDLGLSQKECYDLVTAVNTGADEQAAFEVLASQEQALEANARARVGTTTRHTAKGRLISSLGIIKAISPAEVAAGCENDDQRAVLADQIRAAAKILHNTLQAVS